jgi:hypothetical protein
MAGDHTHRPALEGIEDMSKRVHVFFLAATTGGAPLRISTGNVA